MADSFFSKKRKRKSTNRTQLAPRNDRNKPSKNNRDEDITSESDLSQNEMDVDNDEEDDEDGDFFENENETEADKRRRLAKDYLENVTQELEYEGFDAADLDREIIAARLKEDVAEHQGRVYRYLADKLDIPRASNTVNLHQTKAYGITAVATRYPHAFTVSKDLYLTKWDISKSFKPRQVKFVRGNRHKRGEGESEYEGHTAEILCVATSPDGKYVVTGGRDKKIIVWSSDLSFVKKFDTRDKKGVVMGLAFRRGTNELYASCADLKVRTYNLDQLAQVEILFGHQDQVADIAALGQERCITVGSRDRTAILWKITEESRLTFRGGGGSKVNVMEGSIDCCSMIDDQLFVTGSDNGSISLWSLQKKKPVYIEKEAHGRDDKQDNGGLPRHITSIHAIPYSDVFYTGSYSGEIKVWQLSQDQRNFALVGAIPGIKGIINRIDTVEKGPRNKETIGLYAAVSKEMRLGRWMKMNKGKNGLVSVVIDHK